MIPVGKFYESILAYIIPGYRFFSVAFHDGPMVFVWAQVIFFLYRVYFFCFGIYFFPLTRGNGSPEFFHSSLAAGMAGSAYGHSQLLYVLAVYPAFSESETFATPGISL